MSHSWELPSYISLEYISILRIHVLIENHFSMPPESMIIKMLFTVATPQSSHVLYTMMFHLLCMPQVCFLFPLHFVPFYFILSCPVLFCSVLFCAVLSYSICSTLFCPVLLCFQRLFRHSHPDLLFYLNVCVVLPPPAFPLTSRLLVLPCIYVFFLSVVSGGFLYILGLIRHQSPGAVCCAPIQSAG